MTDWQVFADYLCVNANFEYVSFVLSFKKQSWKITKSFPGGASDKESACQCKRLKRSGYNPWVGKIPWRRTWQPTPVLLPGESHGQRSLAGYSPWGCKESDMTAPLTQVTSDKKEEEKLSFHLY